LNDEAFSAYVAHNERFHALLSDKKWFYFTISKKYFFD
jgi:hypothetical protein